MNKLPIYFSHGYRDREAVFNKYFGVLIEQSGFVPSLDPPSGDVNSAKLEKHMKHTVGLIAVVTKRNGGISPYIRYEIDLAIRGNKPVLVFIEDSVPDNVIPRFLLRKRFSTRSFFRDYREHVYAIQQFKLYIGNEQLPRYQSLSAQKSAALIGFKKDDELYARTRAYLIDSGYDVFADPMNDADQLLLHGEEHFKLSNTYLGICLLDSLSSQGSYLLGAIRAGQTPLIPLSKYPDYPLVNWIPEEFQRRLIPADVEGAFAVICSQVSLYEEDFVAVDNEKKWENYVNSLLSDSSMGGEYSDSLREKIINNIFMGDTFTNISGNVANKVTGDFVQGQNSNITFLNEKFGKEAADAFMKVAELIQHENNKDAEELYTSMQEELKKEKPKKSVLTTLWSGIISLVPLIKDSAEVFEKVSGIIEKF
jgi:hypothetical protein